MALADAKHLGWPPSPVTPTCSTAQGRLWPGSKARSPPTKPNAKRGTAAPRRPPESREGLTPLGAGVRLSRRNPPTGPAHRAARQTGVCGDPGRGIPHRRLPNVQRRRRVHTQRQAVDPALMSTVPAQAAQRRAARPQRRDCRQRHLARPGGRIDLAGSPVGAQRAGARTGT